LPVLARQVRAYRVDQPAVGQFVALATRGKFARAGKACRELVEPVVQRVGTGKQFAPRGFAIAGLRGSVAQP
jgi:hypothetical protein